MSYTLMSGIARNVEHPDSFEIPDDDTRRRVRVGDCVKLMFASDDCYTDEGEEHPWVERMWVQVTHINYPHYRGKLDNHPFAPDAFGGIAAGDDVEFHARHIIDWTTVPPFA